MGKLKEIVISFFSKRGATIEILGEYFILDQVGEEFEKIHGKKAPYKILFEGEKEGFETLNTGSKFLGSFMKVLDKNTATSILKINISINPVEEVGKRISLKNCILKNVTESYENNFFSRFTFKTIFRYLNKTDEKINEIFVHEGKIVLGDLDGYSISEGELEKIDGSYMKEDYNLAREKVRELLGPEIKEKSLKISEKLNGEIERIKKHYVVYKNEIVEKNNKIKLRINELEGGGKEDMERARKLRVQEEGKNLAEDIERIDREEKFAIEDARQKYAIGMETQLENSAVIYYPIYKVNFLAEDGQIRKDIDIEFDPLTMAMKNMECFSCRDNLKEISLCSNKHICCSDCIFRCSSCGKQYCKACLKNKCNSCGGPICEDCLRVCKNCKETFCKQHISIGGEFGDNYCSSCVGFCSICMKPFFEKGTNNNNNNNSKKICEKCKVDEKKKKIIRNIFEE